ncbi:MAG: hypothetical protein HOP28_08670 [Gemmatimonadales bacterium]|nr:hypothetical protein [Gemmatimonadales bacterium]
MTHRAPHFSLAVVAAAVMLPQAAEPQQPRALKKADTEFPEPFSQVGGIRELRDGRVIVIDPREPQLALIDMKTGSLTPIGKQGSGPGEWRAPRALYRFAGDSTLVQDPPNGRFLILTPDGKPARIVDPSVGALSRASGLLQSIDLRGLMYYQGSGVQANAPIPLDSAVIGRFDPARQAHDTVGKVALGKASFVATRLQDGRQARRLVGEPFSPGDAWNVFPDGRIAIARVGNYHLEILGTDGTVIKGQPVKYTPVKIGEAEKREWRAQLPGGSEPDSWPAVKPPFPANNAVWPMPNGETWVARSAAADAKQTSIDVFDRQARWTGMVTLPPGMTIVGVGARHIYAVRTDADDLKYLGRYAIP